MIIHHPVIGRLTPWDGGIWATKFQCFETWEVHGLAFVEAPAIEIAMVMSLTPGTGQFREFVRQLKENYDHIRFWALMNKDLAAALERYGFTQGFDVDEYGDITEVMDWTRPPLEPH